ncbi:MAG: T9SS type A sorting domain-containing protein [Ignavibacteria bacterium]|nr:T9SS type A sorting domain-containing protein [Ignavibacteria bacterium]
MRSVLITPLRAIGHIPVFLVMAFEILGSPFTFGQAFPPDIRDDTASLWINRIQLMLDGRGEMRLGQWGSGGRWMEHPGKSPTSIIFDQGLSVIGKIGGRLHGTFILWGTEYGPGPIRNGRPAMQESPQDSSRYHPYIVYRDDTTRGHYSQWPRDLGAPIDDRGSPAILGDAMVWSVANGLDTVNTRSGIRAPHPRLPVEVRQAAYARAGTACDSVAVLANTVFFEWTIIAKGDSTIEDASLAFWTDIDIGDAWWDAPAFDSTGQFGYCLEMQPDAGAAVGYAILAGPVLRRKGDTALFLGKMRAGYGLLQLRGFRGIGDDAMVASDVFGPPATIDEAWNLVHGLDNKGAVIVNPVTGGVTSFTCTGDPASGRGWIMDRRFIGGGSGFLMHAGPFTLAPADTQWVMIALVAARGHSKTESVAILRDRFAELRSMPYDSLLYAPYPHIPCSTSSAVETPVPALAVLLPPSPNPMRNASTIRFMLPETGHVRMDLVDLLGRRITALLDEDCSPGMHSVRLERNALAPGLYLCRMQTSRAVMVTKVLVMK